MGSRLTGTAKPVAWTPSATAGLGETNGSPRRCVAWPRHECQHGRSGVGASSSGTGPDELGKASCPVSAICLVDERCETTGLPLGCWLDFSRPESRTGARSPENVFEQTPLAVGCRCHHFWRVTGRASCFF